MKITSRRALLLLLFFLSALLLRSLYGASNFGEDDAFQVYLIGLKWHTTGIFPYWGPDVVYTQSQIPGALQGLLVGGPLFLYPVPEAPFLLLNFLSLIALCFLGWYLAQRIPAVPKWFSFIWLLTAPWAMNYSTHIENPSYLLPVAVVFFVGVWEVFPIYEQKIIAGKWAFFWMGFSLFWAMQLHLSWVLMLPYIGLAFWFQAKKGQGFWRAALFFFFGAAITASTLVPTILEFGVASSGGTEQNIGFNLSNLAEIPNIAAKMLSFACGEVARYTGDYTPEPLEFLKAYPWAAPFTIFFALAGVAQFALFALSLFQKKTPVEWHKVRAFMLGSIGLVCLSYLFTSLSPKAHAFYLLFPVAMWYSFYCYGELFRGKRFRVLAIAFLVSGVVFHLALAQKNASRYGLWAKREKVETAIAAKDYTILGLRRESALQMSNWEQVWEKKGEGQYRTGYEYKNPYFMPQSICSNIVHNGQYACKMDSTFAFGGGFKEKTNLTGISRCKCSAFLKGNFEGSVLAVFEVKSKGENVLWQSLPVNREQCTSTEWQQVEFDFEIPPAAQTGDEVMVYFWLGSKSGGALFADDIEVSFR